MGMGMGMGIGMGMGMGMGMGIGMGRIVIVVVMILTEHAGIVPMMECRVMSDETNGLKNLTSIILNSSHEFRKDVLRLSFAQNETERKAIRMEGINDKALLKREQFKVQMHI